MLGVLAFQVILLTAYRQMENTTFWLLDHFKLGDFQKKDDTIRSI
jgi:hypothetical protein